MIKSFCPGCGKHSEEGGLCHVCSLKSAELHKYPESLEITICSVCDAELNRGSWQITDRSSEEIAFQAIKDAIIIHNDLRDVNLILQLSKRGATRYQAKAVLRGNFKGTCIEESFNFPVKINLTTCSRCSRMAGKYFEAIIQIRGSPHPPSKAELLQCEEIASSMTEAAYRSGNQLAFIQEVKETKGGVDLVVGSARLGRQIAKALLERFGGQTKESSKIVGKKDGKDLHRITILVRFPKLKRGDIVSVRGSLFEVVGFEGRKLLLESLDGKRRTSLKDESAESLEVLGNRADAKKALVIERDDNVIEFLDPESFKTTVASKPKDINIEPGQEAEVVRTRDGFIVLS